MVTVITLVASKSRLGGEDHNTLLNLKASVDTVQKVQAEQMTTLTNHTALHKQSNDCDDDHEDRIRTMENWKAKQEGVQEEKLRNRNRPT